MLWLGQPQSIVPGIKTFPIQLRFHLFTYSVLSFGETRAMSFTGVLINPED